MNPNELKSISQFLSKYQIVNLKQNQYFLSSKQLNLLVKSHQVEPSDLQRYAQELDQNMQLDKQYITPLLHFEVSHHNEAACSIKAIYQVDKVTLKDQIQAKKIRDEMFTEAEIWIIISSVVNSLIYLQQRSMVYGRLSTTKIFLQNKIRLLNPAIYSSQTINISQISLQSPELRQNIEEINIQMSDVYLLGLCILQTATLEPMSNSITFSQIDNLLLLATSTYSQELIHVLRSMLEQDIEQRPSFQNIKEYLQTQIQLRETKESILEQLAKDQEDIINSNVQLQNDEVEVIDILEISPIHPYQSSNQYQQAKRKYLTQSTIQIDLHLNTVKNAFKSSSSRFYQSKFLTTKCNNNKSFQQQSMIRRQEQMQLISQNQQNYYPSTNDNLYKIDEFKIQNENLINLNTNRQNKTICKSTKIQQIKKRNSELNRAVHTVRLSNQSSNVSIQNQKNPLSKPQFLKMLRQSIVKHRFHSEQNKAIGKNRIY